MYQTAASVTKQKQNICKKDLHCSVLMCLTTNLCIYLSILDNKLPSLSIVLFGSSSSVQFGHENLLLGEKQKHMENTEVSRIDSLQKTISERHISVFNMIDLHETELYLDCVDHQIDQLVNENEIHVFIIVMRLGQLTNDDKISLEWLQRVFGGKVLRFVMILFTYERERECNTIKDDLKRNPDLEQLLEKCGGRYQTCNMRMNNRAEMRDLMKKIEHLFNENQQQRYTGEMFNTASIRKKELESSEHQCGKNSVFFPLLSTSNVVTCFLYITDFYRVYFFFF